MSKIINVTILYCFLLGYILFGCSSSIKERSKTLKMSISRDPSTLDPRKGGEIVSSTLHYMLFEGLVRSSASGPPSLALAKEIVISKDQKIYTFHLKETFWSNQDLVTAHDFALAWKTILDPLFPSPHAYLLYPIKNAQKAKKNQCSIEDIGIYVLDQKTLQVHLENPTPYFLDLLTFSIFFPIPHKVVSYFPNWADKEGPYFVTNGPFQLKKWDLANEILLCKNPYYWEKEKIEIEEIFIPIISEEMTVLQMFQKQQLDFIGFGISPIPAAALKEYKEKQKIHLYPSLGTMHITLNVNSIPFNNPKVRKAFSYAIHRQELVDNITQLQEEIALNVLAPPLRNKTTPKFFEDNNVQLAQQLLKEGLEELNIDFNQIPEIVYTYSASALNHTLAQALQNQWLKTLNIKVKLHAMEHKTFQKKLETHKYQMAQVFFLSQYKDPMSILERFKFKENTKNYANWENPLFSSLLDLSCLHPLDKRQEILTQAEALLMEEMPIIPLYHTNTAFMINSSLVNIPVTSCGTIDYTRISLCSN